jgi:hypothetical protein
MTNNIKNLTVNELTAVNGGTGVNIYAGYSRLWTKVMGACMQHDYRTAKCPVCGIPLPKKLPADQIFPMKITANTIAAKTTNPIML